jgi:hypothetical protein
MSLYSDVRMALRYLAGLREYWRGPANWCDAAGTIRGWLADRENALARMVQRQIYANPRSPYLPLLHAAGLDEARVLAMIRDCGVEGCLRRLYEAGVYVTMDEFKGRRPIERLGVHLPAGSLDFRVIGRQSHVASTTGGSRSRGVPVEVDVGDLFYELPARYLFSQAYDLLGKPFAMWRPAPPGTAGLRSALRNYKLGLKMAQWFTPTRAGLGRASGKSAVVTWCTKLSAEWHGHRMPYPKYVPMDRADVIARWMAAQKARGVLLQLDVSVGGAVAVAKAARALGLDVRGHAVRVGGEPLTHAKAALLDEAGLRYCSQYAMSETASLGVSCARAAEPDDVHLLTYRMAAIQYPKTLPGWPEPIGALLLTNFSPRMTSVMLNIEVGDYGVMEQRECGCPLGAAGLRTHLHTIRSFEKLVSAGMHFMGADLIDILEVALPGRFGGAPDDYQFVETEQEGETVLKLVADPAVGPLDEDTVIAFVLQELRERTKAGTMMTDIWRDSHLLRLERVRPYITHSAKVQALHVERR